MLQSGAEKRTLPVFSVKEKYGWSLIPRLAYTVSKIKIIRVWTMQRQTFMLMPYMAKSLRRRSHASRRGILSCNRCRLSSFCCSFTSSDRSAFWADGLSSASGVARAKLRTLIRKLTSSSITLESKAECLCSERTYKIIIKFVFIKE